MYVCTQVELRRKEQLFDRQSERLTASHRVIAEQEEELAEVSKELEVTERENSRLRESMEKMLEESDFTRWASEHILKGFNNCCQANHSAHQWS